MTRIALTAILLLLVATVVSAQASKPIFRTVTVGSPDKLREIALGGELTEVIDLLVKEGDSFVFQRGFGGAKSIRVFVTKTARVERIEFDYGVEANFEKKLASYTKSLGKPSERQTAMSGINSVSIVTWIDSKTRFDLIKKIEGNQISVSSVLIDKSIGK